MDDLSSNRLSRITLHQQVYHSLARRILDEEFPAKSFLPNEYDLSRSYQVSIGTVRRAVEELVSCKLVERMQGRGTIVTANCWGDLIRRTNRFRVNNQSASFGWTFMEMKYETLAAPEDIARALKLKVGDMVHFTSRVRGSDAGVKIYEHIYFPAKRFPDLSGVPEGRRDVTSLARLYGIMVGKIVEDVSAVIGDAETNAQLKVPAGEPLLRTVRLSHDRDGEPIELRTSWAFLNGGSVQTTL